MQQFMSSWNLVSCVALVSVDVLHHESNELKIYVFTCHSVSQNLCIDKVTRQTRPYHKAFAAREKSLAHKNQCTEKLLHTEA